MIVRGDVSVRVFNRALSSADCLHISQAIRESKTLQTLALAACKGLDDESVGAFVVAEALRHNQVLRELDLRGSPVGPIGATALGEALKTNKTLLRLNLSGSSVGNFGSLSIADSLKCCVLEELHLDGSGIGCGSACTIGKALKSNKSLKRLHLHLNLIGDLGAIDIAEGLKSNDTLRYLDLHENRRMANLGAFAIANALKTNITLEELKLDVNEVSMSAMGESLKDNKGLRVLVVQMRRKRRGGMVSYSMIADCLNSNNVLKGLHIIGDDQFSDKGAGLIADSLRRKENICVLALLRNDIGCVGAAAIASALLEDKTSLQELWLDNNSIGAVGALAIAGVLKEDRALTKLYLGNNRIGPAGANAIADALACNRVLLELKLPSNSIGHTGMTSIFEALRHNACLGLLDVLANKVTRVVDMGPVYRNTTLQSLLYASPSARAITKRNKLISERRAMLMNAENSPPPLGLWPHVISKWPANVLFGIFVEIPDPLLHHQRQ